MLLCVIVAISLTICYIANSLMAWTLIVTSNIWATINQDSVHVCVCDCCNFTHYLLHSKQPDGLNPDRHI